MKVNIYLPYPIGDHPLTGQIMTQRGWDDLVAHEMRRVDVYRKAYDEYLLGVERNLGKCGEQKTRALWPGVCRKTRSGARSALKNWMYQLMINASRTAGDYIEDQQQLIYEEKNHPRDPVGGKFDGLKADKMHTVEEPELNYPLVVPNCPRSDC